MSVQTVAPENGYAFPLSFQQQRLWLVDRLYPAHPAYNLHFAAPVVAPVNANALFLAANEMVRRHESLRTVIRMVGEQPLQIVHEFAARSFPLIDLSTLPPPQRDDEVRRLVSDDAVRGFDLATGPLFRLQLLRLEPKRHLVLVAMHHIVSDGWSLTVLWEELTQLYAAAASGRPPGLPEPALQYADFCAWQREWLRGDVLETQLDYWRRQLSGAATLALPTDRPRSKVQGYSGESRAIRIGQQTTERLRALARDQQATPFMVLCAAFAALLSRYANQTDVVLGTPITNRNRVELEKVIGFFVNSLVLRFDFSGDPPFLELLKRVRRTLVDGYAHQDIPFERLVEELKVERDQSRNPIFQVTIQMFQMPGGSPGHSSGPGLLDVGQGSAMFDLAASFWDAGNEIKGSMQFSADLFDDETVGRLCSHLMNFLGAAVADPGLRLSAIPVTTERERAQLLAFGTSSQPGVSVPAVHETFAAVATASPERTALTWAGGHLTYGELLSRTNALALRLQRCGVRRGDLVGILASPSPELVIAMLGTLRAGAAWLPLDPHLPWERLADIVRDAAPAVVLVASNVPRKGTFPGTPYLDFVHTGLEAAHIAPVSTTPDDLAYVLYTSGSSGTPKGVTMPHRALANLVAWMRAAFPLESDDTVLYKTPFSFDASIWELFLPLTSGARVALPAPDAHRDPSALIADVVAQDVTVLQLVPSMLRLFLDHVGVSRCRKLRYLFAGGETLPNGLWMTVRDTLDVQFCNLYGPTETCVQSTFHLCGAGDSSSQVTVPIGRAVDGTTLYVVNEALHLQPIGVPGELCIGGAGVAHGYFGQPALTADRFIPDPFGSDPGARIYRTGDSVRWRADGTLEFMGRIDAQVKLRGYRIEPTEIEAVLALHPDVERSVVTVHNDEASGQRLVAYLTLVRGSDPPKSGLRRHLAERLPSYMVPSFIVFLDAFPLLSSGKIDRRELPAPEISSEQWIPPDGPIEEAIADVWAEVLGLERIGADDDFFIHLGGHSLLATRVAARLNDLFQIELPLRWLFEHPTVRGLAEMLCRDDGLAERMKQVAQILGEIGAEAEPTPGAARHIRPPAFGA